MKNLSRFLLLPFLLLAPDSGGSGGGASPSSVNLEVWFKKWEAANKKNRPIIMDELAKVLNVSVAEAWKILQEAGLVNPNSKLPKGSDGADEPDKETSEKKQTVTLRHKTTYPHYRRAGLVLTDQAKPYEVTEDQLAVLEKDAWVEIKKG